MRYVRSLVVLALAPLLIAAGYPADVEATYAARFQDIATSGRGELSGYDPLETVPGANFKPLPVATSRTVTAAALAEATAYAEANRSSAFIVIHKGKVQTARYFGTTTATTAIVSKSLAKPITALAVGRALKLGKTSKIGYD